MLTAVTGTYRNGGVELSEKPVDVEEGAEVVVMFLPSKVVETSQLPVSLRGAWAGKIPEDMDIDAILKEVRSEWEKEWEDKEVT